MFRITRILFLLVLFSYTEISFSCPSLFSFLSKEPRPTGKSLNSYLNEQYLEYDEDRRFLKSFGIELSPYNGKVGEAISEFERLGVTVTSIIKGNAYEMIEESDINRIGLSRFMGSSIEVNFKGRISVEDYERLKEKYGYKIEDNSWVISNRKKGATRTFVMIKPDAFERINEDGSRYGVIGEVISEIENAGFKIVDMEIKRFSILEASLFYREHRNKSFYRDLISYITSGSVIGIVIEKERALEDARYLIENIVRPRYGVDKTKNTLHGSDSYRSYRRESGIFFGTGIPGIYSKILSIFQSDPEISK